jgi:hypothetical protein
MKVVSQTLEILLGMKCPFTLASISFTEGKASPLNRGNCKTEVVLFLTVIFWTFWLTDADYC